VHDNKVSSRDKSGLGNSPMPVLGTSGWLEEILITYQVARKDDLAATSEGHTVDGGNHGLLAGVVDESGEASLFGIHREALVDALEVGSSAKDLGMGRGDDSNPERVVLLELVHELGEPRREFERDGVHGLGAVQCEDGHVAAPLELDDVLVGSHFDGWMDEV